MVNVRKFDGTLIPFDKDRVMRTCLRMRLPKKEAEEIADEIEKEAFEGMSTKKVIDMILEHGRKHKKFFKHIVDLKEALGIMRSKPDFEQFVALLLEDKGYKTITNKIVQGRCIDHEIDVIAVRGNETIFVEVKHHKEFHTFTGLDTLLEINSSFEDLVQGYEAKRHKFNFTKAMLVSNTKMSNHSTKYANCRGIDIIGWSTPEHGGIESYVHSKLLYPTTILKDVDEGTVNILGDSGVFTLKQLLEADFKELSRASGINSEQLRVLVTKAEEVLGS